MAGITMIRNIQSPGSNTGFETKASGILIQALPRAELTTHKMKGLLEPERHALNFIHSPSSEAGRRMAKAEDPPSARARQPSPGA